jgi:hypothetical protein
MTAPIYQENQSFRQPWLWALLGSILVVLVVAWLLSPEGHVVGGIVVAGNLGISLFIYVLKLTVHVDAEAVRIRFFPLWKKTIRLADIASWEPRTYRPILEYGGWGIRYGLAKGWAYNVSGNRGVQLELTNGQRILIGSQRAEKLAAAIGAAKGAGVGT